MLPPAPLTALYTRLATAASSSSRAGARVTLRRAQSPCALCSGAGACFHLKEPREGLNPRRDFVAGDFSRGKTSRGWRGDAPGPEDLLGEAFPRQRFLSRPPRSIVWSLAEILSRAQKPSRGKMPREARQAESLVLSRISCGAFEGCGRPAQDTLVSIGPTLARNLLVTWQRHSQISENTT